MVIPESRPLKRVKRTHAVSENVYEFHAFPTVTETVKQPFRCAVRAFLKEHARVVNVPSELFPSLMAWEIGFSVGGKKSNVRLCVVEEDVKRSRSLYCNHCRVVGWSRHPVCNKRYHFIIRGDDSAKAGYRKPCPRCGDVLFIFDLRCKSCKFIVTPGTFEDCMYSLLEDNSHLLHGVVHSNGYGHIITVNGKEGGSKLLSGRDIVDFWDRLCRAISVRKVSVMDMSKKYGVAYRVLHAIVKCHSWYGDWGYEFGSGSYGITIGEYRRAINTLSNIPLSYFFFKGRGFRSELQDKIYFYQSLSDVKLLTVRDLFVFLERLISQTHKSTTPRLTSKEAKMCTSDVLCFWTRDEVDQVQHAMIRVLQALTEKDSWVTRRALKGATCRAASLELLDYSLKHLGGKLTDNGMIVRVRCSGSSNSVEYRLEPCSNANHIAGLKTNLPTKEHIMSDLKFLYDSMLDAESMASFGPGETREHAIDAATKLLDCKQFIKDYEAAYIGSSNSQSIYVRCHVVLPNKSRSDPFPPPEPIVLPISATVAELKREVTKAFQEVYVIFKRFQVNELLEFGHIDESLTLTLLIGTCGSVAVGGKFLSKYGFNRFRMERGTEDWIVDCECGAKDDDGERMLACDSCGVWQHTRCAGIDKPDASPIKFFCSWCQEPYPQAVEDYPQVIKYDPRAMKLSSQAVGVYTQAIGWGSETIKYDSRSKKAGSQEVENSPQTIDNAPKAMVWGFDAMKYDRRVIKDGCQEVGNGTQVIKDGPRAMREGSEAMQFYPGAIKDACQKAESGPLVIMDEPPAKTIKYDSRSKKAGSQEVENSPQTIDNAPKAMVWGFDAMKYDRRVIKDGCQEVGNGTQVIKDGPRAMREGSEAMQFYPGAIKDACQKAESGPLVIMDEPPAKTIKYDSRSKKAGSQEVENSPQTIDNAPKAMVWGFDAMKYDRRVIKDGCQEVGNGTQVIKDGPRAMREGSEAMQFYPGAIKDACQKAESGPLVIMDEPPAKTIKYDSRSKKAGSQEVENSPQTIDNAPKAMVWGFDAMKYDRRVIKDGCQEVGNGTQVIKDGPRAMREGSEAMQFYPGAIKDACQKAESGPLVIMDEPPAKTIKYDSRSKKAGSQEVENSPQTIDNAPKAMVWGFDAMKYDRRVIKDGCQEVGNGTQVIKDGPRAMREGSEAMQFYPGAIKDACQEAESGPLVIMDEPPAMVVGSEVNKYLPGATNYGCQEVHDRPQAIKDSPQAIKDSFLEVSQVSLTKKRCRDEARAADNLGAVTGLTFMYGIRQS